MPPVKRCKKPTKRPKSNVPALIHVRQGHYVIAGEVRFPLRTIVLENRKSPLSINSGGISILENTAYSPTHHHLELIPSGANPPVPAGVRGDLFREGRKAPKRRGP